MRTPRLAGLADNWEIPAPEVKGGKVLASNLWCSVCADERRFVDPKKVPTPPKRLVDQRMIEVVRWLEEQPKVEPIVMAGRHTVMVTDLPGARETLTEAERNWMKCWFPRLAGRLTAHQRAHLVALRYFSMEARVWDSLCLFEDRPFFVPPWPGHHYGGVGRMELFVFATEKAFREFGRQFFGAVGKYSTRTFNDEKRGVCQTLHLDRVTAKARWARFDHGVAHLLLGQYKAHPENVPGWLDAGFAHFIERGHDHSVVTACTDFESRRRIRHARWDAQVRSAVVKGRTTPLARLAQKRETWDLSRVEHMQSWSLVTYMNCLEPERWRKLVDGVKGRSPDESELECLFRAMLVAYETDIVTFERGWKRWVLGR